MKNKIFAGMAIIILIGIIIIATIGLNVDLNYTKHKIIDIYIGQDFNISDIKTITDEIFPKQKVIIQKATEYEDTVCIKVADATDEQVEQINQKINEKYGIQNTMDDVANIDVPKVRLRELIKPYIVPLTIVTILILVYMGIAFNKLGVIKVIGQTGILLVLSELFLLAIIAITRYPVNNLVIPTGMILYVSVITILNYIYSKENAEKANSNKSNKKEN